MAKFTNPLDNVRIAAPCPASWDAMTGDARVRFCGSCELNVYNLSGMSKKDAEALLQNAADGGGRLCVRFYRRADGTILTQECPVGLRLLKRRVTGAASAVLSALLSFAAGLGIAAWRKDQTSLLSPPDSQHMMGAISPVEHAPVKIEHPPAIDYVGQPVAGMAAFIHEENPRRNKAYRNRRAIKR